MPINRVERRKHNSFGAASTSFGNSFPTASTLHSDYEARSTCAVDDGRINVSPTHQDSKWTAAAMMGMASPKRLTHSQSCTPGSRRRDVRYNRRSVLPVCAISPLAVYLTVVLCAFVAEAHSTARCYSFAQGKTVVGGDYRRDYDVTKKACAETCKLDACCMAFEWREWGGTCTLKSRSLNGSVEQAPHADTHFALCLDYGDDERNRFWDHELIGPIVASTAGVDREKCAEICTASRQSTPRPVSTRRARKRSLAALEHSQPRPSTQLNNDAATPPNSNPASAARSVIYNWRTNNPEDMDESLGTCECVSLLHNVRLSFGSFAGFLL